MKILRLEICDNSYWLLLITVIAAAIIAFTFVLANNYNERAIAAFKAGYSEGALPGNCGVHWVKK